jgi:hypothetical protein
MNHKVQKIVAITMACAMVLGVFASLIFAIF